MKICFTNDDGEVFDEIIVVEKPLPDSIIAGDYDIYIDDVDAVKDETGSIIERYIASNACHIQKNP